MAGPSSEISFLLEYRSSRRSLNASSLNVVPSVILKSLKERFNKDFTLKYSYSTQNASEESVAVDGDSMIQRWSSDYNCYVDVLSLVEIKAGDRLTLVPCPRSEVNKKA